MVSNFLDIVYIIIIGLSLASGIHKGAVKLIISFTFFILSFVFSYLLLTPLAEIINEYVTHSLIAGIISFFAAYLVSAILCGVISGILQKLVKDISGGSTDRVSGLILGAGRGVIMSVILSTIIMIAVNKSYKDAPNLLELTQPKKPEKEPHWVASSRINPVLQTMLKETVIIIGKDTLKKVLLPKIENKDKTPEAKKNVKDEAGINKDVFERMKQY